VGWRWFLNLSERREIFLEIEREGECWNEENPKVLGNLNRD